MMARKNEQTSGGGFFNLPSGPKADPKVLEELCNAIADQMRHEDDLYKLQIVATLREMLVGSPSPRTEGTS
jgi:hypothetical protein